MFRSFHSPIRRRFPFFESLEDRVVPATTVNYATAGTPYIQNFDSLVATGTITPANDLLPVLMDNSTYVRAGQPADSLDGWAYQRFGGTTTRFLIDAGASTTGSAFSYGAASNPERALGAINSGSNLSRFGVVLVNNTGTTLTQFALSFTGEQWRFGGAAGADNLTFEYGVGATDIATGTFVAVPTLDYSGTITTGSAAGGTTSPLATSSISSAVTNGFSWNNGEQLVLRWSDTDKTGSDDGLAVDNISFSAQAALTNSISFTNAAYSVDEAAGTATISVARTGTGAGSVNVTAVAGGTATAGTDYTAPTSPSFTLSWTGADPDGAVKSITFPIANDTTNEPNETVNLQLVGATGSLTLGAQTTAILAILDNDAPTGLLLNEISVDPPTTTDTPNEWVELKGAPGATLNNTYLVYVPGDVSGFASTVGVATKVVSLAGAIVPANGLIYISSPGGIAKQSAGTLDVSTPAGSSSAASQSFFNGTGTFLLLWSPTAPVQGIDYDANNDGTFETFPAGVTLDSLGFKDADLGDVIYATAELIDSGSYAANVLESADAATRLAGDTTANSAAGWYYGNLDSLTATSLSYGPSVSANAPVGAVLTPGAANSIGSPGGIFAIENTTYSVSETGAPALTISVTRTGGSGAVSVSYTVGGGSATANFDYVYALISPSPMGPLNWANGDFAPKQIVIPINDDMLNEGSETFNIVLTNPTGGAVIGGNSQAVVTIGDDDTTAVAVVINELDVAPPGTDNPFEYVEFRGVPATGMGNVFFVGVEGDGTTARGQVNYVRNLSGTFIGNNGLTVLKADSGGFTFSTSASIIPDPGLASGATGLQNGTNSWLLIYSPDGSAPVLGTDYDVGDDGVLDDGTVLTSATILDAVAWSDGGAGDLTYGGVVLGGTTTPEAATRFRNDTNAKSAAAWYYGTLSGTLNSSVTYSPASLSPGAPVGAVLTPGDRNFDPAAVYLTTPTPLPAGTVGVAYSQAITATGGTGPYMFGITSGATTPNGLILGSNGVLSGTPTARGTFSFEITAHDAFTVSDSRRYSITIAPAPTTTSLVANPLATTGGTLVMLTATVAPSPGAAGNVSFFDNGAPLPGAANVPVSGGVAVFSTSSLAVGSHPITAVYNGSTNFAASPASNTQTVVVSAGGAPAVVSVTPNGTSGPAAFAGNQRSRVVSLTVVFNQAVQLDANAMALALHTNSVTFGGVPQPAGMGAVPANLAVNSTDNVTWTVTFSGAGTELGADNFSSLQDGVYDLTISAAKVHPLGNAAVNMAANSTTTFHRLFGDIDLPETPTGGTAGVDFATVVNTGDNLEFRTAFNRPTPDYKAFFDFDGTSIINTGDNLEFRNRFNRTLAWKI
jgi:hypothetical protein